LVIGNILTGAAPGGAVEFDNDARRRSTAGALGRRLIITTEANETTSSQPVCSRCNMAVEAEAEFCNHCGNKIGPHRHVPWWHLHRRLFNWTLAWAYKPSAAVALFVLSFAESSFFPIPPDVLLMPLVLGNRKKWVRYAFTCSLASVMGAVFGFAIGMFLWGQVGDFFHDRVPGFGRDEIVLVAQPDQVVEGFVDQESLQLDGIWGVELTDPVNLDGGDQTFPLEAVDVDESKVHAFSRIGKLYESYNFGIVFTAGFTPIPFKVITVTAGIFGTGEQVANPTVFFLVFLVASTISRSARFFLVAGLMRKYGSKITPFIDKYFNWLALLFMALLVGGFAVIKYVL
jgi:membrane protein YqaA with SNARE-associated domain